MLPAIGRLGAAHARATDPALKAAGKVAVQADTLRRQLRRFDATATPGPYPEDGNGFPERLAALAALAAMVAAGLPLECVALQAPGAYATHDNQVVELEAGLSVTAASLLAFQRDLEARGLADRVVTLVWSEFGRRAEENGSGTDHGAAGLALVIGSPVLARWSASSPASRPGSTTNET